MDNSKKLALGLGAAAVGALVAGILYNKFNRSEDLDEDLETSKLEDENYLKAQELKKLGNKAFGEKKYEEAIQFYTEALEICDIDTHLLYSNRSAAQAGKGLYDAAIEDAEQCIRMKPEWSKGYFRKGRALLAKGDFNDAFIEFYRGFLVDPKSEELRKMLDQTKVELGPGDLDTRGILDKQIIEVYFMEISEKHCEQLGVSYQTVREKVRSAVKEEGVEALLEEEPFAQLVETNPQSIYLVLAEILMNANQPDAALTYSTKAFQLNPNDSTTVITHINAVLRNKNSDFMAAVEMTRNALKENKQNVLLVHTLASVLLRVGEVIGTTIPIRTILQELKVGFDNPNGNAEHSSFLTPANHLLIADSGVRIWFKLFEDPEITQALMAEEQRNMMSQSSPEEAYLFGITQGAFSKLCLEPFFVSALSLVVFNNPGLERILAPFRIAFLSLKVEQLSQLPADFTESQDTYEKIAPFIYALGLQSARNNYSWPVSSDEQARVNTLLDETRDMLNKDEELVHDGKLDSALAHHLILISLYQNLDNIPGLRPVFEQVDRSKIHPFLADLWDKTAFSVWEQEEIKETLQVVTPIPESSLVEFYDKFVPVWDSAGLLSGRLTTISLGQELKWFFPNQNFDDFTGENKVLVASSGQEVYQISLLYSNIQLTVIDVSANRLAYTKRQMKALGHDSASFYVADINTVEPSQMKETFDMIIATNVLAHLEDPLKGWSNLAGLLRSGGLMRISLYSSSHIEVITKGREFIRNQQPGIFGKPDGSPLPRLIRHPTPEKIQNIRSAILDADDRELDGVVTTPLFYNLAECASFLFHPQIMGFSFASIGQCIEELGLQLVGFEFPGIGQEWVLRYRVEYPDDPQMSNFHHLEEFDKKYPEAFQNFTNTIQFVVRKP